MKTSSPKKRFYRGLLVVAAILVLTSPLQASTLSDWLLSVPGYQTPIQPLEKAVSSLLDSPKDGATAQRTLKLGESLLGKTPRGYHDEILELCGLAAEVSGDSKKAETFYRKSLELRASNASVLYRLALVLQRNNRCQEALPLMEESLWRSAADEEAKTKQHLLLTDIASCQIVQSQGEKARKNLTKALGLVPNFLPALRSLKQLAETQLAVTDDPKLRREILSQISLLNSQLAAADPGDAESILVHARSLLQGSDILIGSEKLVRAEFLANKVVEESNWKNAEAIKLLYEIKVRLGKNEEGNAAIQKGLELTPGAPALLSAKKQIEIEGLAKVQEKLKR